MHEQYKRQAAERAVEYVESGMVLGLGHGTTAIFAVRHIAELLRQGVLERISGVPCSTMVAEEMKQQGIPFTTLEEHPVLDLTIDGADEVTPTLEIIKGRGGAMLREKIVAQASRREIIVVDDTKLVETLGSVPLPVEVVPFGWRSQVYFLEDLGARPTLREENREPWRTDQGNFVLDCEFGPIDNAAHLAERLQARAGIVAHGLFLGLVSEVIAAGPSGIRQLNP